MKWVGVAVVIMSVSPLGVGFGGDELGNSVSADEVGVSLIGHSHEVLRWVHRPIQVPSSTTLNDLDLTPTKVFPVVARNEDWLTCTVHEGVLATLGVSVTDSLIDLFVLCVIEEAEAEGVLCELDDLVFSDSHFVLLWEWGGGRGERGELSDSSTSLSL
jgi:hypothetical protein